jgi:hypothetical protein
LKEKVEFYKIVVGIKKIEIVFSIKFFEKFVIKNLFLDSDPDSARQQDAWNRIQMY